MDLLITSLKFLNHKEKIQLIIIFLLLTISSFLEMVGVGLILPLLTVIMDSNFFNNNEFANIIKTQFDITSKSKFIIIIVCAIIFANLSKALFLTLSGWKQINYMAEINKRLSNQIYLTYANSNWKFLVNKNSSILLRNIHTSTQDYIDKVLQSYLLIAAEVVMIIFLLALLIFVNPLATSIAIIFCGIIGYLTQKITKKYNYEFGKIRYKYLALRQKHILETFKIIKLIRILNKFSIFEKNYLDLSAKEIKAKSSQQFFNKLPSIWIEFVSIFIMCSIIIFVVKYYGNINTFIPTIGLYVVTAFKLLPSLIKVLALIQTQRFAKPVILNLKNEIEEIKKINQDLKATKLEETSVQDKKIIFDKNIQIHNLDFFYTSNKHYVFNNFNYEINKNEILGIVGESGSGKSTLVDLLIGISKPQSGKILIDGKDDINNYSELWQNTIGYVPQDTYLLDDSIKKNIAFGIPEEEIDIKKINEIIVSLGLKEMIDKLSLGIESNVGENGVKISGGQKQRIGIARALYISPQILVLDEATSALDIRNEENILKLIGKFKKNMTIIIVSHRQSIYAFCDKILNLDKMN